MAASEPSPARGGRRGARGITSPGGEWCVYANVPGVSGYPTTIDQYNQVTFIGVGTTRLRAVLQSGANSVGVLEVKAFG